ncbi:diacylglycerol kinase family protein [Streptomyces sp. NPDC101733]|uniref:diacylglycerol kinase family protein n=1 Tax=unclassified Streptomyces TaxID=2593676 RepID=UPI003820E94D
MTNERGEAARRGRPLLLLPVQLAVMVALGSLVTGLAADRWPLSAEDDVNRTLAEHRVASVSEATRWLSLLAGTQSVIALTVLCVVVLLLVPHASRYRHASFLAASVAVQSAVFVLITLVVERPRPDVPHLDGAPPTSSFPSGHVGASVALFGGLATLAAVRLRGARRWAVVTVLLLIPPAVAFARVYRGMHHPSDVIGGLLNGACTLLLVGSALLPPRARAAGGGDTRLPAARTAKGHEAGSPGGRRVWVVRHPLSCDAVLADRVRAVLDARGRTDQVWTETTAEDPSGGLAARLREEAAPDLVVVCGGDGTVRACADAVASGGVPLAIVPCGTGNLLARNLRLPSDPAEALDAALSGESVGIDVARVRGDGLDPVRFTVMAGAGLDAAMVGDASARLKERLGWPAYVLAAVRHLQDPRMRLTIRLDDGPVLERRARMVVIGNVGTLQGGLPLLPDARPDSGRLEVVLLDPRGPVGWLAAAGHLLSRMTPGVPSTTSGRPGGPVARGALEYFAAARVDVRFTKPQPRELDGDVVAPGTRLSAEIEPGALRLYLPRRPAPGAEAAEAEQAPDGVEDAQGPQGEAREAASTTGA